jgi:hypothetical protein
MAKPTYAPIFPILIGTVDDKADNTGCNSGRLVQLDRPGPWSFRIGRLCVSECTELGNQRIWHISWWKMFMGMR